MRYPKQQMWLVVTEISRDENVQHNVALLPRQKLPGIAVFPIGFLFSSILQSNLPDFSDFRSIRKD